MASLTCRLVESGAPPLVPDEGEVGESLRFAENDGEYLDAEPLRAGPIAESGVAPIGDDEEWGPE